MLSNGPQSKNKRFFKFSEYKVSLLKSYLNMQRNDLISRGVIYKADLNIISSSYPAMKTEAPEATDSHELLIPHLNPRICLLKNQKWACIPGIPQDVPQVPWRVWASHWSCCSAGHSGLLKTWMPTRHKIRLLCQKILMKRIKIHFKMSVGIA